MKKILLAAALAVVVSGCTFLGGGKAWTEAECRALDNFVEFDFRAYEDAQRGMSDAMLEKFTWHHDYCEYVQEDHNVGGDADGGDGGDGGGDGDGDGDSGDGDSD